MKKDAISFKKIFHHEEASSIATSKEWSESIPYKFSSYNEAKAIQEQNRLQMVRLVVVMALAALIIFALILAGKYIIVPFN